jgi:hypothetical protein
MPLKDVETMQKKTSIATLSLAILVQLRITPEPILRRVLHLERFRLAVARLRGLTTRGVESVHFGYRASLSALRLQLQIWYVSSWLRSIRGIQFRAAHRAPVMTWGIKIEERCRCVGEVVMSGEEEIRG